MKEKLTLRMMRVEDIPEVAALERMLFALPWTERMFRNEIEKNLFSFPWVLESEAGEIVGYVVLWLILDELHVATVGVSPGWQGKGLGRLLMAWSLFWGKKLSAEETTLEVRPSNEVAIGLYSSLGFRVVGRRKRYYSNKEDALIMTKKPLEKAEVARIWEETRRKYDLVVEE
jgi:ribosomal-protein-alanine N-acetyltransferase